MKKCWIIASLTTAVFASVAFTSQDTEADNLRKIYSRSPGKWPAPFVDAGVEWKELGVLPASPLEPKLQELRQLIELGKILFFDPRLSAGKISCASCHQPELSWTDGKEKSIGHEGAVNKRNSPSLQNVWFFTKLFWDGRAKDLEDQAFAPINSETEMHGDMRELVGKLRRIKGYLPLFNAAYGDPAIDPDRIAGALAVFQRTIVSRKSRLDDFLTGKKNALSDGELRGLHLFRTKARCINCHNGPLFSDNQFHNNGFAGADIGLYHVTHKEEDRGKLKTPSLRDIMKTGPWLHDGSVSDIRMIVGKYNSGTSDKGTDPLIKELGLSPKEKSDLIAFLGAISAPPLEFVKPVLPE